MIMDIMMIIIMMIMIVINSDYINNNDQSRSWNFGAARHAARGTRHAARGPGRSRAMYSRAAGCHTCHVVNKHNIINNTTHDMWSTKRDINTTIT